MFTVFDYFSFHKIYLKICIYLFENKHGIIKTCGYILVVLADLSSTQTALEINFNLFLNRAVVLFTISLHITYCAFFSSSCRGKEGDQFTICS